MPACNWATPTMAERRGLNLRLAAVAIVVLAVSELGSGRARADTDLFGTEPRNDFEPASLTLRRTGR